MNPSLALDALLVLALLLCGAAALGSRDLFRAVVMFIAFGLVMSLAWVRLQAPDLALTEAALGAGLTGALLLDAVGQLRRGGRTAGHKLPLFSLALCLALAGLLAWIVLTLPSAPARLRSLLAEAMPESGLSHEVTAVLLNFRGYDTFLEISVLAAAVFVSLALMTSQGKPPPMRTLSNALLDAFTAWLAPLMLLVAFFLYWAGSKEPGGAFQAGSLLAAGGVLLRLTGVPLHLVVGVFLHLALAAGFGVFLLAGLLGPLFFGLPLFSYPAGLAGVILVGVEAVLALSIGITLLCLFAATPPYWKDDRER